MVKSQLPLANSEYRSRILGYEYEYFVGKPVVRFQTDQTGFATVTQKSREYRDVLAQSHLALQEFYLYLANGGAIHAESFMRAGSALLRNLQRVRLGGREALVGFSYLHKKEYPGHRLPWASALVQGAIIRVMCRMWQMSNREEYLAAALAATEPFFVSVERGGIVSDLRQHGKWYEEYPFASQCRQVLNGFLTALFSLHELFRVTKQRDVLQLWSTGLDTLKSRGLLDRFDTGDWTRYDLTPRIVGMTPASFNYHNVHVVQMSVLSKIVGEKCFCETASRWASYSRMRRNRILSHLRVSVYRFSQSRRYIRELLSPLWE
jgi:hypothetical protein